MYDADFMPNQVVLLGGQIYPKEFYVAMYDADFLPNAPRGHKFHGLIMKPALYAYVIAWKWGSQPSTVEQGRLCQGETSGRTASGDDLPIIRFWTHGPGVRPTVGTVPHGGNLLLISQDTFAHILLETSTILDDPFPDHTTAGMSIILAMYDTMADGSFHVQHMRAFVIPNIFAHALADLPN